MKKGLTVVEMIIAIASGIVIVLAISFILYSSHKTYFRETKVMELKREAVFGIRFIERKLREKQPDKVEIQDSGNKLIIKK
ncbi:MAG: PilW family protein [Candidatus Ratteibacteria bacterium]